MTRIFFLHAKLIDGINPPRDNMTVVVEGNSIVAVEHADGAAPPGLGDQVFDAHGFTLMPGLFQCHLHAAMGDITSYLELDFTYPANYLTLIAARNADRMLHLGFTSAIGAGSPANIDVVLKHAINAGLISGPRLTACGRHICTTGESLDSHPSFWNAEFLGFGHPCGSPDEFRKAVRTEIKDGADIVKVHVTGGHGSNYPVDVVAITFEELLAASQAAHERGKKIRTHSSNKAGILASVRAGVDLVDHTDFMDDECIEAFLKNGTTITAGAHATVRFLEFLAAQRKDDGVTSVRSPMSSPFYSHIAFTEDEAKRAFDNYCEFLPRAVQAGVNVVSGDDVGGEGLSPHGRYADELVTYVKQLGIPAKDVIAMATRNPARFLGRDDLGVIGKNKVADLIIVKGNPLEDITVLQQRTNLAVILKDGAFVECNLAPHDASRLAIKTRSWSTSELC